MKRVQNWAAKFVRIAPDQNERIGMGVVAKEGESKAAFARLKIAPTSKILVISVNGTINSK